LWRDLNWAALLYADKTEAAISLFERGVAEGFVASHAGELVTWNRYPPAFRNSPGFKRLLVRSGVLAYWHTNGFPPQSHAVGRSDFNCD
jgi:hypothetical protein